MERFDQQIAALFQKHPDRFLFECLPGAGAALAPRLLAAFGADRDRFQSAQEVQQLSGIAPVTERSGKQHWVHWRWACSKFLRQSFHEFADHSRKWCRWAKAVYQQLRRRGQGHHAAVRMLAFKWIRILFHCWKTRSCYDEQIYLTSLQKRNPSPWADIQALPPRGPQEASRLRCSLWKTGEFFVPLPLDMKPQMSPQLRRGAFGVVPTLWTYVVMFRFWAERLARSPFLVFEKLT